MIPVMISLELSPEDLARCEEYKTSDQTITQFVESFCKEIFSQQLEALDNAHKATAKSFEPIDNQNTPNETHQNSPH